MRGLDATVVDQVLEDWRTAPVDDRLRAMLGYLEKLTLAPDSLTKADIAQLHACDLTDEAIYEAAYVCFMFSIIVRLADSFEFEVPDAKGASNDARFLYTFGYKPTW